MKKVFVAGASGNVGAMVVGAILSREDMELVGGYCLEEGKDLGVLAGKAPAGVRASGDLRRGLEATGPDVVVDFTSTTVLMANLKIYAELGLDAVIGTTGLTDDDFVEVERMVAERGLRFAIIPNYGLGISLIMDFLERAREFYPYVSIVDRHPARMANAPSGTAAMLAQVIPEGSEGKVASREIYPKVLGAHIAGCQVISQRMPYPGPFSEHEITLGRDDEVLRITISDFTSSVYLDGILLTVDRIGSFPKKTLIRKLAEVL